MGQKTNPKAFRLVTTQKHLSSWHSVKKKYPRIIKNDLLIRERIKKMFDGYLSLSNIKIFRKKLKNINNQFTLIKIYSLFPRSKELYKKAIDYFENGNHSNLKKVKALITKKDPKQESFISLFIEDKSSKLTNDLQKTTGSQHFISFHFIENIFEDATLIAKYISNCLERRIPFRRIIKHCLRKVAFTSAKGIRIELSGRLNGIEIARTEWKREGKIPLHTLKAKIDYASHEAYTVYGVIGIKVWLFIE